MSAPLVTAIVPAYNAERYLADALDSVFAQGHSPLEVIVVDDGSTDGTAAVADSYTPRVELLRQANAGAGAARNHGLAAARGDYVAFHDADDLWTEGKLSAQLDRLVADPSLDLVFGHVRNFVSPNLSPAQAARLFCPPETQPGYSAACLLARRSAFERVGPFREDVDLGEFIDWMARAREHGLRDALLPETVLLRRLHGSNTGIRQRDSRSDFALVVKQALDRRRASART
jgi:glycosyltransferase involved in cell wall biosynthesis